MKRLGWRWLVVSSLLAGALAAEAETRPQYGGTLRLEMWAAPTSLDPADSAQPDSFARRSLIALIFDTLVSTDKNGRVQAALADSWQASPGSERWQFRLRHGVNFHDGTPLTADAAAGALRAANPSWKVSASGDAVVVELNTPNPELPAELALARNAIAKRNPEGKLSGTGPFHIVDWQPGKKLTLAAEDNCWHGRPFLDGIEIEMGKNFHDQITAFEAGKADLGEVAAEQTHRFPADGRRLASSAPMELLALLFSRDVKSPQEKSQREALALSVERGSIRNVLLQGAGEPTAAILPNWMSGYGFVFSVDADLPRSRQAREQAQTVSTWTIGYDNDDPLTRLLAERIALNAKDAGLTLQPTSTNVADLRLVRIPLASADPWITLAEVAALTGVSAVKKSGSVEDLYTAERALLATERVIPLFHLPVSYEGAAGLKDWSLRSDGSLDLSNAWLGNAKP